MTKITNSRKKRLGVTLHEHGADFRVWAPHARKVELIGDWNAWQPLPMKHEGEYWSLSVPNAEAGHAYQYQITTTDGTVVKRNDPRARQISDTDAGNSLVVADKFEWHDNNFVMPPPEQQVIYEMHIGTFNRPDASTPGTFGTAIEKLDYLKELGVTTVELMPVTSMATCSGTNGDGWGYNPSYIFSVEASLGGRHGLMEFVDSAHQRGMGVVLDIVYNHFTTSDLWQFDGWSENGRGGIYFYNDARGDTPWGGRPNYSSEEVRSFLKDNVAMWLMEYHIDGFRFDSTAYMRNTNGPYGGQDTEIPDAWSLLGEIADLAHRLRPHAFLTAEDSSMNDFITRSIREGGIEFNSQWGLGFPWTIRQALGLKRNDGNPSDTSVSPFIEELLHTYNNDVFDKVIFSDSHDTAANGGTRLNDVAGDGDADGLLARKRVLVASAVTITSAGIPMLLQGQEFLQDGDFNAWKTLEWDNTERLRGMVDAHKHLLDLRHNKHGNTAGLLGTAVDVFHENNTNRVVGYRRFTPNQPGSVLVIANFGPDSFDHYDVTLPMTGEWKVRFNSTWSGYSKDFNEVLYDTVVTDENGRASIALADYQVIILSQD